MNLFSELGIWHSVVFDKDQNQGIHDLINSFIESKKERFLFTKEFIVLILILSIC